MLRITYLAYKEQYGDMQQDGNSYRNICSSLMLSFLEKQPSVDDDIRKWDWQIQDSNYYLDKLTVYWKKCKWVSADGTTIYISVHRWSKYDKGPCWRVQARFKPIFFWLGVWRFSHMCYVLPMLLFGGVMQVYLGALLSRCHWYTAYRQLVQAQAAHQRATVQA